GGQFTFPELVGANLIAGGLIVVLGLFGMGEQVMRWLPLPIVMGMFAGSILDYIIRMVKATVEDFWIAGPTVIGYLAGRAINRPGVPPMGAAVICGALAIFFVQPSMPLAVSWTLPAIVIPEMEFSVNAIVAVSLPLVVLSMVLGNVQGLGFLIAQGYRVPVKSVTVLVGIASVLNALLGGYPAIVGRTAVAILAAPDAGPPSGRYAGTLVAAVLTLLIALAAGPLTSLLALLPRAYIVALAGLAIFSSLQEACEKAFGGRLKFGALVAFAVAATPFSFAGINSAFWALIAGLVASLLIERGDMIADRHEKTVSLD
ncbi:MAG: benzoate/H(+) symporter BenE family transporter, partial [Candidatus Binatia bacterium]